MTKEEKKEKLLKKIEAAKRQLELLDAPTQFHEAMDAGILSYVDGNLTEIKYDETTAVWIYIRYLVLHAIAEMSGNCKKYFKSLSAEERKIAVEIAERYIRVWNDSLRKLTGQMIFTEKETQQQQERVDLMRKADKMTRPNIEAELKKLATNG